MKPLLLDANMLLVLLAGDCDRANLGKAKCVKEYSLLHWNWIAGFVRASQSLVAVPNVLTEVSNLIGEEDGVAFERADVALADYVSKVDELYFASPDIVRKKYYWRVGLTDAVLLECAIDMNACLLTADHKLYGVANTERIEVYNPWHQFTPDWVTN